MNVSQMLNSGAAKVRINTPPMSPVGGFVSQAQVMSVQPIQPPTKPIEIVEFVMPELPGANLQAVELCEFTAIVWDSTHRSFTNGEKLGAGVTLWLIDSRGVKSNWKSGVDGQRFSASSIASLKAWMAKQGMEVVLMEADQPREQHKYRVSRYALA